MIGKPGVAPCGHAGEHIVSTYVQCLIGCDTAGRRLIPRQGELGHKQLCTCLHCKVRRTVIVVLLTNDAGSIIKNLHWDGLKNIKGHSNTPWAVSKWMMLDDSGDIVADGAFCASLSSGPFELNPMRLIDMF